jgi:hypothetical protein
VSRNTIDLYIDLVYCSYSELISCFLKNFYTKHHASVNRNMFTSFSVWILFVSFSCLSALASTSNTILSRSGKSGPLFLVPDFRGIKHSSFSPLSMMLDVDFS